MSPRGKVTVFWPEGFDQFWAAYPRRVSKIEAQVAWAQLKPTPEVLDCILTALTWQCQQVLWLRNGGDYVPFPATYLRGQRWQDEPPTSLRPVVAKDRWLCPHTPWCPHEAACRVLSARAS